MSTQAGPVARPPTLGCRVRPRGLIAGACLLAQAMAMAMAMAMAGGVARADTAAAPVPDTSREAFSHPRADLGDAEREAFWRGRSLFRRAWVVGARGDGDPDSGGGGRGLGPLYNRLSCVACHPGNGRGQVPDAPGRRLQSALLRLSVPGRGPQGAPRPHPAYGDQLQEEGVPGVPGEGRVQLRWWPVPHTELNGRRTLLRRPEVVVDELAYGPLLGRPQRTLTSLRVGPAVFGLGLLQAVPDAALRRLAGQRQADGFHGQLNQVWDPVARRLAIGRFGWKANTASVAAQVVQAAHGDLGLTSDALPGPGCSPLQTACLALARQQGVDLGADDVAALTAYLSGLAPPGTAPTAPTVERGRALFSQARCSACHQPSLPQPGGAPPIAAYTDLLLHDLGAGLADGRPDHRASGRQWRTAPLWGVGLVPVVNEHSHYLHDGRARNLHEAVLWHDGQARRARLRYERLSADDQAALLAFVAAL